MKPFLHKQLSKTISLLVIFMVVFASSKAQPNWIKKGATWNFKSTSNAGGWLGHEVYTYTKDSLIYGKNCQEIKGVRYNYSQSPVSFLYSQSLGSNYTYNNGDTVFYLTSNGFKVLYNFGATVGDTWNLGVDTNFAYCSKSIEKVDSIKTVTINSYNLKCLYVGDVYNSSVGIGQATSNQIIEHIGSTTYLFPLGRNCDTSAIVDFFDFSLLCFSDSSLTYSLVSSDECDNPFHVGINELENNTNALKIYPNPTTRSLTLTLSNGEGIGAVQIYNVLGECVLMFPLLRGGREELIDVSKLKAGIYLIKISTKNENIFTQTIIKND